MKKAFSIFAILFAANALIYAGPEPLSGKEMKQIAPAPPSECNWTGFYIGLNVGGQVGHSENKISTAFGPLISSGDTASPESSPAVRLVTTINGTGSSSASKAMLVT